MEFNFTPSQAKHAQEVADRLFKQHRFFLPNDISSATPLPHLDPKVFDYLYKLDEQHRNFYRDTTEQTKLRLQSEEGVHGIAPARLTVGQSLVECKRYTGGLDIVAIVPLQFLLSALPMTKRISDIARGLLDAKYPDESRDDFAPAEVRAYYELVMAYAEKVRSENADLIGQIEIMQRDRVVVVLETRFEPGSFNNDFMQGKLEGLVTYPHLSSYLLFKQALSGNRLSQKGYTIFTSSRYGHISLDQTSDRPMLVPDTKYGYECKIAFATIL